MQWTHSKFKYILHSNSITDKNTALLPSYSCCTAKRHFLLEKEQEYIAQHNSSCIAWNFLPQYLKLSQRIWWWSFNKHDSNVQGYMYIVYENWNLWKHAAPANSEIPKALCSAYNKLDKTLTAMSNTCQFSPNLQFNLIACIIIGTQSCYKRIIISHNFVKLQWQQWNNSEFMLKLHTVILNMIAVNVSALYSHQGLFAKIWVWKFIMWA